MCIRDSLGLLHRLLYRLLLRLVLNKVRTIILRARIGALVVLVLLGLILVLRLILVLSLDDVTNTTPKVVAIAVHLWATRICPRLIKPTNRTRDILILL